MEVTFEKNGMVLVDDARIIYKNFAGKGDKFNREGDRKFSLLITSQEVADAFIDQGYNVKIKAPRDEDDTPFMYLEVKVKFNNRGPVAYLKSGSNVRMLDEDTIEILDNIAIDSVDMDIRPYDWEANGKTGRAAYLQSIHVTQKIFDRFADRYSDM